MCILRVVCRSRFRSRFSSAAAACSVRVVLLRLAGVVRINCDSHLPALVDVLVHLADVAAALVCDRVLRAGALLLTVGLDCACRLLQILFLVII